MPAFSDASIPDLIASARALYAGVEATPEVAAALADYGCKPDDIQAGLDLVEDVEARQGSQAAEYAGQYAATAAATATLASAEALFLRYRKLPGSGTAAAPTGTSRSGSPAASRTPTQTCSQPPTRSTGR